MGAFLFIILFFAVFLSGMSVFLFKSSNRDSIKLLLAFSGAYLLALTFLHLIPEIYESSPSENIGIYILAGFFLQVVLEMFSMGIEHGHSHSHSHFNVPEKEKAFPLAMLISLFIHSFLEAMPLAYGILDIHHQHHDKITNPLLLGIILHKIPISIVLVTVLMQSAIKKKKIILVLFIFAAIAPLGAFFSYLIGENMAENIFLYFNKILAVVIGIFLHISTTILFESSENHRFNMYKFITIVLGAIVAILSL